MRFLALCTAAAVWASAAAAASITLDPVEGPWRNVIADTLVTRGGTSARSTVSWGVPATDVDLQSGYRFTGATPDQ